MPLLLIIAIVVALYAKSIRYKYMPDDSVRRDEYLYNVPETLPSHEFTKKIPPLRVRLWLITNHCLNVAFIYVLFGWKAALLFAVHPVAVNATCWVTGNYYAGTTLLVLAGYWCISMFGWFGAIPALAFYTAALNSTLTSLGIPFFYLITMNPIGMTLFLPLIMYLRGDRFVKGLVIRKKMRQKNFDKLNYKKLSFMTKVVYEYIGMFFLPLRMALFRSFGEQVTRDEGYYNKDCAFNAHFMDALMACVALFAVGMWLNPMAILWFFCLIAPHSQFKIYGQSNPCNRYLYMPMIGLCILAGYLPLPAFYMFAGFLMYKTYLYIPAWRDQESLHKNNLDEFPERPMSHSDYAQFVLSRVVPENKDQVNRVNEGVFHMQEGHRMCANGHGPMFEIHLNMAFMLSCIGNQEVALEQTRLALSVGRAQGLHGNLEKIIENQVKTFEDALKAKEGGARVTTTTAQSNVPTADNQKQISDGSDKQRS